MNAVWGGILSGVLTLQPDAFRSAVGTADGWIVSTVVILVAGISESIGQSVVLFANRVKPLRFVFSLFVNALLFACGYAFLVLSTWGIVHFTQRGRTGIAELAVTFALSYLPYWLAFLIALPYLGFGIGWALRTAHLVTIVVGVAAVAGINLFDALVDVSLGWLALSTAQQTFGKPVAVLGEKILSAVAGVEITSNEQIAIERFEPGMAPAAVAGSASAPAPASVIAVASKPHSQWWKVALGLAGMAAIGYVCAVALQPVRSALFGWQAALPKAVQVPLDLAWIAVIGVLVAGFMAPLETLGWWAGWYGDAVKATVSPEADDGGSVSRYVVYMDGISQSGERYTADVEAFLDALAPRLPTDVRLVRGVMAYSVINRPLDEDPILSWFWSWVDRLRTADSQSLIGMFVNLRNVLIVAVSADTRYGPIYNYGIAQLVYDSLVANGYRPGGGTPVTFIGYSGGAQMAAGCSGYVKHAIDGPVDVISLGGVMSGNGRFLELEHLYHFVGEKDNVERLGPIMFPSRWRMTVLSNWNRARRMGRLSIFGLGPVGHQVPGGMLDPELRLPNGQTALDQTLERIDQVLNGRIERQAPPVSVAETNYARYITDRYNQPANYPIAVTDGVRERRAAAEWIGRLALPSRDERRTVQGAWFEVHHAPDEFASLVGTRAMLRWGNLPITREAVRAVKRDVHFSAQAEYTAKYGGLVQPVRVDHWQLVDPLESLAGSHPVDDLIVSLAGAVDVAPGTPPVVRIERQPVQITGRYRALVRFLAPADGDGYEVAHYDRDARAFEGARETLVVPKVVPDDGGREPSLASAWEHSPLNAEGWYVYGTPDSSGRFVVQSMLPRRLLSLGSDRTVSRSKAMTYLRKHAWKDVVATKGGVLSVQLGEDGWRVGDRALVTHVYGGIGGEAGERAASGPVYFGHFAFGFAEVVEDPLSGEPRFEIFYEQVYTHNGDGLIAGALAASRYVGDRQFGWSGLRPMCDVLIKLDPFTGSYPFEGTLRSPLDELLLQLEVMTARYRIGDGTGATYVGIANNCSQDSNRALFAALEAFEEFAATDWFRTWRAGHPEDERRIERLGALTRDLRRRLEPFRHPRRDWSENRFNLGASMAEDPIAQIRTGLGSWRVIFPRTAAETIAGAFFKHGATGRLLATDQLGIRPDLEPVVPMRL